MINSGMSYKFLLLSLAILFGLSQGRQSLQVRHEIKLTKDCGEPLVRKACHGLGHIERECRSLFQEFLEMNPKGEVNATQLAFYAIGFVKVHAILVVNTIKNISASESNLAPMFQSSLADCQEVYDSFEDLLEDAESAIYVHQYKDGLKYMEAATTTIALCDKEFSDTNAEERKENKSEDEIKWSEELKDSNDFLKNILIAGIHILKAK